MPKDRNKNSQNNNIKTYTNSLLNSDDKWAELLDYLKQDGDNSRLNQFVDKLLEKLSSFDQESFNKAVEQHLSEKKKEFDDLQQKRDEKTKLADDKEQLTKQIEVMTAQKEKLDQAAKKLEEAERIKAKAHDEGFAAGKKDAENQGKAMAFQEKQKTVKDIEEKEKKLDAEILKLEQEKQRFSTACNHRRAKYIKKKRELTDAIAKQAVLKDQAEAAMATKDQWDSLIQKYQTKMEAVQSEQEQIQELKNKLQDKEAENIRLTNQNVQLQEAKKQLRDLSLEVTGALQEEIPTENIVKYIGELKGAKLQAEETLDKVQRELTAKRGELGKKNEDIQTLRNENQANKQRFLQVEANQELVAMSQAVCRSLMEEMKQIKSSLDTYYGDPCKGLSEIDNEPITKDLPRKHEGRNIENLSRLVTYVRDYAATEMGERKPLYYTLDDIRAFVAGLGTSQLLILQGMSGTGKSSLPAIFAEALHFHNGLIPVESSWRDVNDLLGYYNDFSRQFNTKPFTQELYRAAKQETLGKAARQQVLGENFVVRPRFITLDEMNLARIEYYFSEFLSKLENQDPAKRVIDLCTTKLRVLPSDLAQLEASAKTAELKRKIKDFREKKEISSKDKEEILAFGEANNLNIGPKYLIDGCKIHIPENLWFIGTANRDESTFTITDKVYDRAQVISLDKKGEKQTCIDEGMRSVVPTGYRFVTSEQLLGWFKEAKENKMSDMQTWVKQKLEPVDEVLQGQFKLSFGNRIETQAAEYACVFEAAGGTKEKALDYQISTKILRKVESCDSEDKLNLLKDKLEEMGGNENKYEKSVKVLEQYIEGLH